jgi:hypothetical protein
VFKALISNEEYRYTVIVVHWVYSYCGPLGIPLLWSTGKHRNVSKRVQNLDDSEQIYIMQDCILIV